MGPFARPGLKSCFTVGNERGTDKGKETEYYYCTRTVDEESLVHLASFLPNIQPGTMSVPPFLFLMCLFSLLVNAPLAIR